jgi:geranylgeranylglycerol-phosphate geranylgeranyltransferase
MASLPLRAWLELTRPGNAIAAGVLTFTGAFVSGGVTTRPLAVTAAVIATVTATGGGNAINDYFDREIDAVNQPDRPIPRGAVSPREALGVSIALFTIATVAALTLPRVAIGIAVGNLLALIAYTELFKGRPVIGNALVAYLTGSAFLFGGAAVGDPAGAGILFLLAAVATLTREIVKDVEDIAGDREEGLRTLPIVAGRRPALWLGVAVILVAVVASVVPYTGETFGLPYLLAVAPADAVMLWAAGRSFRDPTASQRWLKRGMFLATAAFVIGRAAVVLA